MRKMIGILLSLALVTQARAAISNPSSFQDYTANGATNAFAFTFPVLAAGDVEVLVGGVKQLSGVTVTLNANQATSPGGTVTLTIVPANLAAVRVQRTVSLTQGLVLQPYSAFPAKSLEKALDRQTQIAQQLERTKATKPPAACGAGQVLTSTDGSTLACVNDNGSSLVADGSTVTVPGGVARTLATHLATLPDAMITATGGSTAKGLAAWAADVSSNTSRLTALPSCPPGTSLTYNGTDFACVPPASVLRIAFTKPGCYPTGSMLGSFGERVTFARAGTKACAGVGTCQTDELCVDGSGYSLGTGEVLTVPWPSAVTANAPFCVSLTADATNWATFQALLGAGAEGAANTFTSWVTGATLVSRIHDSAAVYNNLEVAQSFAAGSAHRVTLCRTGSTLTAMLDGAPISGTATGAGTGSRSAAPSPIYLGSLNQSYKLTGHIREVALCRGTDAYSCATARSVNPMRVAALGDSITAGTYCSLTTTYPQALQTSLGAGWTVTNLGVSGETSAQILTRWGSQVKPNDYGRVVVMGGVNDAAGATTAAQTFANLKQIYDEARLEGLVVVPVTIWPANYYTSDQRAKIASVNASILSYCAFNGIRCVDTASLVDGSGFLLAGNTCDGLHLNQTGSNALAALVDAVVP